MNRQRDSHATNLVAADAVRRLIGARWDRGNNGLIGPAILANSISRERAAGRRQKQVIDRGTEVLTRLLGSANDSVAVANVRPGRNAVVEECRGRV